VSAGQHIIEVEKIDSVERATATVAVTVSERVVSFMNLQGNYLYDQILCEQHNIMRLYVSYS